MKDLYPNSFLAYDKLCSGSKSYTNFANEFLDDCRQSNDGSGGPFMKLNRESTQKHPIEKVGNELRSKMKFLNSEKLVDKNKN